MKVSAIVVTYNRLNLLRQNIQHLLNQSSSLNDIFVINNNSTDGTTEYLNNLNIPKVKPFNTGKNLGGAGGFSFGTKLAYEKSNSNYFWLMDDDTIPTKNALSELLDSADNLHEKFGYLCSNVRWYKTMEPSYLNVPVASKDWNYRLNNGLIKTISASFVSLLVPRNMVNQLGLPLAQMFIWGDDVEYTTRLSQKYNSYLVANSIVLHKSKNNFTNETVYDAPMNRLIYYKCMFRNRLYVSRKYYKLRRVLKVLTTYLLYLIKSPFCSKNHRFKRFIYIFCGIMNGLFFKPKVHFPNMK